MNHRHLLDAEPLLSGARFDVLALAYPTRDGRAQQRQVVVPSDAVVILPLLDRDTVVLIRNERPAVGKTLWELPAGTLEPDEDPAQCAARELLEETGYHAQQVQAMTSFYTSPGFCTERMFAYLAQQLTFQGQNLDDTERIQAEPTGLDQALAMIRDNRIQDGKTIATLLYYMHLQRGEAHGLA